MPESAPQRSRVLDVVSVVVLLAAIAGLALRFGPARMKVQAANLYVIVAGDAVGCTIEDVWNPLDADLYAAGKDLMNRIERVDSEGGLSNWSTPFGEFWTPPGNDLLILLAEYAVDDAQATLANVVGHLGRMRVHPALDRLRVSG